MAEILNYRQVGEGPPLLILHGLMGSGSNWNRFSKALAEDFSCYALDLRNHGRSFHHSEMDYPTMASDVLNFMNQQELPEVSILGHSMGGKAAMELALTHQDRVEQLLVVDIAPVTYPNHHGDILRAMASFPLDQIQSREDADRLLAVEDPSMRGFLLTNLSRDADGYKWRINLDALTSNIQKILSFPEHDQDTYQGPAHFIAGENSNFSIAFNILSGVMG